MVKLDDNLFFDKLSLSAMTSVVFFFSLIFRLRWYYELTLALLDNRLVFHAKLYLTILLLAFYDRTHFLQITRVHAEFVERSYFEVDFVALRLLTGLNESVVPNRFFRDWFMKSIGFDAPFDAQVFPGVRIPWYVFDKGETDLLPTIIVPLFSILLRQLSITALLLRICFFY